MYTVPAVLLVQGYDAETVGGTMVHPVVEKLQPVDELGLHLGPNLGQGAAVGLGAEGAGQNSVRGVLVGRQSHYL